MASIDRVMALAEELKKKKKDPNYEVSPSTINTLDLAKDIQSGNKDSLKTYMSNYNSGFDAPIGNLNKKDEEERSWFRKGAFEDGYDFGDISKSILGTINDVRQDVYKGGARIVEGVVDTGAFVVGGMAKLRGNDKLAQSTKEFIKRDWVEESKIANLLTNLSPENFTSILGETATDFIKTRDKGALVDAAKKILGEDFEGDSVLGDKSESLVQSAGQLAGTVGLQAVGVPWWLTTGVTSFGGETQQAFQQDATYGEAAFSGLVSAGAEILTEKISGGISFGGKTLDGGLKKLLNEKITNKTINTLAKFGIDVLGEGGEEVLSEVISNVGKKLSYEDEKTWGEMLTSEEAMDSYLEAFIGGAVLGGGFSAGKTINSIKTGRDYDTGLTANEQAVVDIVVEDRIEEAEKSGNELSKKEKDKIKEEVQEDLQKGYISTDTIERTLGGDTYNQLKTIRNNQTNLENQIAELENKANAEITVKEMERLQALREKVKKIDTNTLETQLQSEMGQRIQSDAYLQRSYQEKGNRGVNFTADLSKYDAKQQEVVQKAIDSGILNNTNRTHDFVDMVAKIAADKGISFDFTNNENLKKSGFAVEGKTVNGYIKDGTIAVNIQSSKALNRVVGHEITHVLEGTPFYTELQNAVKRYATTKGEYDTRLADLTNLYKDVKDANVENELTADLVGDYLFTDPDFINNLSTEKPSLFKKVYNEIKHLYKMATAGSKEARELLKVKKAFEKAYKENAVARDTNNEVSVGEVATETTSQVDSLGRELTAAQIEFFKDSKVRDADGNLLVMYHGTGNEFDTFDISKSGQQYEDGWSAYGRGFYFTPDKVKAEEFSKETEGNNKHVKEVYLNVKNPFYANEDATELFEKYGLEPFINSTGRDFITQINVRDGRDASTKILQELGYDGVIETFGEKGIDEVVVFNSNQIKNVDNLNPTNDPDIRYSLSATDNKGRTLSEEQIQYFKDSKVRDEDGNLKVVYHGSEVTDITIFKKDKFGDIGINFLTDDADIADTYRSKKGRRYEFYADIKNPLIIEGEGKNWNDILVGDNPAVENMYNSLTEQEKTYLTDLAKKMNDMYLGENLGREQAISGFYQRLNAYNETLYDRVTAESGIYNKLFDAAKYNWNEVYLKDLLGKSKNTNQIVREAYESGIYDGVIFKNIVDRGTHYHKAIGRRISNVYVTFNSNQIKNTDNTNPTNNPDIRYSLSEDGKEYYYRGQEQTGDRIAFNSTNFQGDSEGGVYFTTDEATVSSGKYGKYTIKLEKTADNTVSVEESDKLQEWATKQLEKDMRNGVETDYVIEQMALGRPRAFAEYTKKPFVETGDLFGEPNEAIYYEEVANGTSKYGMFDEDYSLSNPNEQIAPSRNDVFGSDIKLQVEEAIAPLQEEITQLREALQNVTTVDYAPATQELVEQQSSEAFNTLDDIDSPQEVDDFAPIGEKLTPTESLFETRDYAEVGNQKIKAYQYENPEVRPYFQQAAREMMNDLDASVKGERFIVGDNSQVGGGDYHYSGTTRHTTEDIAELLDGIDGKYNYTYAEIRKGLQAIIEDNGLENNAVSKRIEFYLDKRLREGYTDIEGYTYPADEGYLDVLRAKGISDYYSSLPIGEEPVTNASNTEDIAPVRVQSEAPNRAAFNEAVRESARAIERDLGYTPQNPTQESTYDEIAEILTEEPQTANERNQRKLAIIAANVLDKGLVFENVALKNKNRELMGKWDYTLTSEARAQTAIGQGHYDNETGKTISKSLNEIMEEVNNTGLTKQFYEYIYHKHNVDRMQLADKFEGMENKPVFGFDVTAEDSQEIVNQYEFSNPEFMDFAQDVYDYVNADRKLLVDNGVISQETADLWSKMYPHYVPIRREGHNGNAINVPLDTGRTGINAPIKKATGGSSNILPLFDTMAARTIQTYRATAKNSFGVELMNTLGTKINSTTTNVDEVIDSVDAQESLLQENNGKPTFTVFENGEKITFSITKDMYDALKPLSDSSILSKTIAPLNIASSFHRGLLTQYNPVFAITNGVKDMQDILINSQHVAKTYAKMPEAYKQVLQKGYWYQEYMANGGEHNSYFDSQDNTFKTENKGLYKLLDAPPLKQIAQLNDFIEIIPRLSEYIASREMGRSIEVSMLDAARVTTNFKAGGNLTKFLNRNGATFLNASVQGAMQQVRNIREAKANGIKGWANLATKFVIAGLPAILLNAMIWDDDEEYEELSDYVKQNYYIVAKTDDGKFIRIPKGRTVAVIQDAIEQMKNFTTGDDEVDLASFIELVITNLAPSNPIDSNVFAPIIQTINNETWYGEDLVPTRLQNLPAAEQYDESTDMFSRWLGENLNISPVKINYLLDQYSGGLGDVILPTLTPEAESGDDSFLGNMIAPLKSKFTTDAVMNNQNVSDFYSMSEKLTTNANKSNATDEDVLKNKYFNSVKAEMNELYAQKREIQNSDLPSSEKYSQVREVQGQINELSKNALNSYEDIDIQDNYATVGDRQYKVDSNGEWEKISSKQLEKQNAVTDMLGINPNEYWRNKEEYDYAYENPSKYAVATAITDYSTFKTYSSELYDIKADKDENGKSISGSRKTKVFDYINNLDLEFEQRVMLAKLEYPSYDEYNYEVIEYLNNREDIDYQEMALILTELGFTVDSEGTIHWD